MKNNKRKEDEDDDDYDDDIEEVVPPKNKKQSRPVVDTVDKKKKRKIEQPSSVKKAVVKGVNDALRDFQNTFGISSPSNSASSSSKARSTPSSKHHAFKSSFDAGNATTSTSKKDATGSASSIPTTTTKTRTDAIIHNEPHVNAATPIKNQSKNSNLGSTFMQPSESHKKLLTADKGKGRAVEDDNEDTRIADDTDNDDTTLNSVSRNNATKTAPLSELSTKRKQFKLLPVNLTTPSRPSPLSGRQLLDGSSSRLATPSAGDVKPLKSLGAISGLGGPLSTRPASIAVDDVAGRDDDTATVISEAASTEKKPKWAQLLQSAVGVGVEGPSTSTRRTDEAQQTQDLIELLSPRKKRKGWVPTGYAENASGVIKRFQTGSNLWIHEISRTLQSSFGKSASVKKEQPNTASSSGRSYADHCKNLNPHLRMEILEILSPKPASLTWSSSDGGFITAGAAEKLFITRCRLLKDDSTEDSQDLLAKEEAGNETRTLPIDSLHSTAVTATASQSKSQFESTEGMVIFSLAGHSRTSTGLTLARKEQQKPSRGETSAGAAESGSNNSGPPAHNPRDPNQPLLQFNKNEKDDDKTWNVFIPASIADLHTQMRIGDEIWAWEPWSVVDLLESSETTSSMMGIAVESSSAPMPRNAEEQQQMLEGEDKTSEKALLISRFGVLV